MSVRMTFGVAGRVLTQIRHDRRTIGLMLMVPSLLLALLYFVLYNRPDLFDLFDRIGLILLGIFRYVSMFLVASVAMLRERTSGTLERLLSTPLHKLDLLVGTASGLRWPRSSRPVWRRWSRTPCLDCTRRATRGWSC
nr:hypothetical protein [Candidatus Protofrankia californiensis]